MYSNLSKWFATTSSIWGNGARISMAIGRRPTDIKTATSNVMQSVVRCVHEELVQAEKSEAHTGGEIPVSDLFENNHISHF